MVRDVAPSKPVADDGPPVAGSRLPVPGLSLDAIRAQWPAIVDAIRSDNKRLVAEAVADTEPVALENGTIALRHLGKNPMTPDSISRNRTLIEAAASRVLGTAVKVVLGSAKPVVSTQQPAPNPEPQRRLSPQAAKSERANALRGKDPALDKAMEAMDLELLD